MIIDRFEGNYAIVEYQNEYFNIPINLVKEYNEGDVLKVVVDDDETVKRKENINKLMNQLFE